MIDTVPVAAAVRAWLREETPGGAELPDDHPLIDGGILTSLTTLELVVFLESRFGIVIDEGEITVENFSTIRSAAELVAAKRR